MMVAHISSSNMTGDKDGHDDMVKMTKYIGAKGAFYFL